MKKAFVAVARNNGGYVPYTTSIAATVKSILPFLNNITHE